MPVTIWITSTRPASAPNEYQKLRFLGATYLPHSDSQIDVIGNRSSIHSSSFCMSSSSAYFRTLPASRLVVYLIRSSWEHRADVDAIRVRFVTALGSRRLDVTRSSPGPS